MILFISLLSLAYVSVYLLIDFSFTDALILLRKEYLQMHMLHLLTSSVYCKIMIFIQFYPSKCVSIISYITDL